MMVHGRTVHGIDLGKGWGLGSSGQGKHTSGLKMETASRNPTGQKARRQASEGV